MAVNYEYLALKFAPALYYVKTKNCYRDICPKDMGGVYWRAVPSSVRWADVCIQYIVYFTEQRWVPSILDKFLDIMPGNHPNDYAPIFLYFKNGKPVRVVYDICHYEAVGAINSPSPVLPSNKGPVLEIENFYRGFSPMDDCGGYDCLGGAPIQLGEERLSLWWRGFIYQETFDEKARLIIRDKLNNPFKKITTFRDRACRLGFIFQRIFRSTQDCLAKGVVADSERVARKVEKEIGEKLRDFSHSDIKELTGFVNENIFDKPEVLKNLALRRAKMFAAD